MSVLNQNIGREEVRVERMVDGRTRVSGKNFCQHFETWDEAVAFAMMRGYLIVAHEPSFVGAGAAADAAASQPVPKGTAADVLSAAAATFRERNAVYKSNYLMVGPMVKILFPDGVPPEVVSSHQFHLFELMLVKLSRFAISNLTHQDSIRDAAVYAAMIESIIINKE